MEYACRYPSSMLKQSPRGVLKSCTERFYIFHRKETHVPLSLFQYTCNFINKKIRHSNFLENSVKFYLTVNKQTANLNLS